MTAPQEFICPITMNVMQDPVVGPDGHTYERTAIVDWLTTSGQNQSPMTREPMTVDQLKPNYALRTAIERWISENGAIPQANASRPVTDGENEVLVLAILDTSGSMDESATNVQSQETLDFSRLDLVKHSMKTVASMLNLKDNTYMGIIGFNSYANRLMRPTLMNGVGLGMANQAIDALYAGGSTNIWDGLRLALEDIQIIRKNKPKIRVEMILLTDGEPTASLSPPLGIVNTFKRALPDSKETTIRLNTFGFGYRLDTALLGELCDEGSGIYGYIPDCSMVATVFINYCSHILTNPKVELSEEDTSVLNEVSDKLVQLYKHANILIGGKGFIYLIKLYVKESKETPITQLLLQDLEDPDENKGQLSKAVSRVDWFSSWGKNHILSYSRALKQKVCVNFKDLVLQEFMNEDFKEIQGKGNDLFAALPAPVPRGHTRESFQATGFTMNIFNTADGGCFLGECLVTLKGGLQKRVDTIKKGDVLHNNSVVLCVVERSVKKETKMVILPGGLVITPWHPIRPVRDWVFPCLFRNSVSMMYVDKFYDFVLAGEGIAKIDGYDVATLGHGMTTNSVVSHSYYGTGAVIEDLMKKPGWESGHVKL